MNEQDEPQAKPKDKPLYRDPVKMVPLIGASIAAILGVMTLYGQVFPASAPSKTSVEYVLDTSEAMKGKLGERDKFESVKEHILIQVDGFPEFSSALRFAGGACQNRYEPPDVGFGQDNEDDFEAAMASLQPAGRSDLANALQHVANDLVRRSEESSIDSTTVYVFVAGVDQCSSNPVEEIRTALQNLRAESNVLVDFKLIGVDPSKAARGLLKEINKDAKALGFISSVTFAKDAGDLSGDPDYCDLPAKEDDLSDCR